MNNLKKNAKKRNTYFIVYRNVIVGKSIAGSDYQNYKTYLL